ncbi:MAG: hypothetical protein WKF94_08960 [Solirubrobacteraceae bacterium]
MAAGLSRKAVAKQGAAIVQADGRRRAKTERRAYELAAEQVTTAEAADRLARAALAGDGTVVVGPWLSEVGFEVLYWVPMLRALVEELDVDPARIVAVSRGGPRPWYAGIAGSYVDVFDTIDPGQLRVWQEERTAANLESASTHTMKQLDLCLTADMDELLTRVGVPRDAGTSYLLPGYMYQAFRPFWHGLGDAALIADRLRFRRIDAPDVSLAHLDLPERYVAVKG